MILGPKMKMMGFDDDPYKRTTDPYVTGTSIISLKTKDCVVMAADTLGSYGRMARFTDFKRIHKIGTLTLMATSGELSDLQKLLDTTESMQRDDTLLNDGISRDASEWHTLLTRMCYSQRKKIDPYYNLFAIGGLDSKGVPYLGYTDYFGTSFKENYVCTGFGHHLALPIIRRKYREDMTVEEAQALIQECMRVLYYRDCRASRNYTMVTLHQGQIDGLEEVRKVVGDWSVATHVKGYDGTF